MHEKVVERALSTETLPAALKMFPDFPFDRYDEDIWKVGGNDVGIPTVVRSLNSMLRWNTRTSVQLSFDGAMWRFPDEMGKLSSLDELKKFENAFTQVCCSCRDSFPLVDVTLLALVTRTLCLVEQPCVGAVGLSRSEVVFPRRDVLSYSRTSLPKCDIKIRPGQN